MIVISVSNLTKTYNNLKAVDNLSFSVEKQECFGLLGPNGAGKTTTMKIIYGKSEFDKNKKVSIDVFGFKPYENSLKIKSFSGIVPQQDNLDNELDVFDNLYIFSRFYGIKKEEAVKRINELLEFMEIKEKAKTKIKELSGGMQRRLTIARALLNNPKLLILDEPTTGLDPQVRHLIWNKLRELKDSGVTILITTHYMEEAFQLCDRIIIMDKGKKIIEGSPKELLNNNMEKYVIEIYNTRREDNQHCKYFDNNNIRYEFYEDVMFAYANNLEKLNIYGEKVGAGNFYIRLSNLEDIFLKVTGRKLNEHQ